MHRMVRLYSVLVSRLHVPSTVHHEKLNEPMEHVRCEPHMKVTSARKIAPTGIESRSKLQLSHNAKLFTFLGVWPNGEVCAVRGT